MTVAASQPVAPVASRTLRPERPLDPALTLACLRRGGGDPTGTTTPDGSVWRALQTPDGPVTLRVRADRSLGEVTAEVYGPGGGWALEQLPSLLGELDDDSGFVAHHEQVARARRRVHGWRIIRTGLVMEALVPAIIEQKVTGQEAFGGYRRLVRRFGRAAPGVGARLGLHVAPTAAGWAAVPSWEFLQAGVDASRSATIVRAAKVADRLEECIRLPLPEAHRRLRAVPGIGVWTAAETRQRALGDPDAVSFRDYHLAGFVGVALTGERVDDEGLARLLEPYAGQRHRATRLLELTHRMPERHGPRLAPRGHLPVRRGRR